MSTASNLDTEEVKIIAYVELLNEGVEVYRPVAVSPVGEGIFRIMEMKPDDEDWSVDPGSLVIVRNHATPSESIIPVCYPADR